MSQSFLPYSRPLVLEEDIAAVVEVLRNPMISQGEQLPAFEAAFAEKVGGRYAVAYSSGTAALHGMCGAAGLGPGDTVIVPALTFAGTSNAVLYTGARPVFADIEPTTLCLSPEAVRQALAPDTTAILTVDFGGHPSNYDALKQIAQERGLLLLSDAAHAVGAVYEGKPVGSLADMTAFSFNPVKNITSAEGGMVVTDDQALYDKLLMFRVHGMTRRPDQLVYESPGGWYYEQQFLGFNYKLSELHAVLGLSQLKHLDEFNRRRRHISHFYHKTLIDLPLILPEEAPGVESAWHLYPIQVTDEAPMNRAELFAALREKSLGVQVHYIPVPLHPYYRALGYTLDTCPHTVRYYDRALSIPLHPAMQPEDAERVAGALRSLLAS